MPGTPIEALPYPAAGSPVNLPADLQALADRLEHLGVPVAVLTTVERDALAGADLFAKRVIVNTTTGTMQRYTGAVWTDVGVDPATINELARDAVGAALVLGLVAGNGIDITLDDAGERILVAIDVAEVAEVIRDTIGVALVAGPGLSKAVNDAGDTITLSATTGWSRTFLTIGA